MKFISDKRAATRAKAERLAQVHAQAQIESDASAQALAQAIDARIAAQAAESEARAAAAKATRRARMTERHATSAQRWADRWDHAGRRIFLPAAIASGIGAIVLLVVILVTTGAPAQETAIPAEAATPAPPETIAATPNPIPTQSAGAADAERQATEFRSQLEAELQAESEREAGAERRRAEIRAEVALRAAENQANIERERQRREAEKAAFAARERPINAACASAGAEHQAAEFKGEELPELTIRLLAACAIEDADERVNLARPLVEEFLAERRRQAEAEQQRQAEERRRQEAEAEQQRQEAEAERQRQEEERRRQEAERLWQERWDSAHVITYDDLFRNNEQHVGKTARYRGEVVQVIEGLLGDYYELRVNVTWNGIFWDDTVYLSYEGPRLLEDDLIDFVGNVDGLFTYESILGQRITIPEMTALEVRRV